MGTSTFMLDTGLYILDCEYGDKASNCIANQILCEQFPDECCDTCKDIINRTTIVTTPTTTVASTTAVDTSTSDITTDTTTSTTAASSTELEGKDIEGITVFKFLFWEVYRRIYGRKFSFTEIFTSFSFALISVNTIETTDHYHCCTDIRCIVEKHEMGSNHFECRSTVLPPG